MKKLTLIFTVVLGLFMSLTVKAQTTAPAIATAPATSADYYPGKWNVVVKGTPNGDAKMTFVFERKDEKDKTITAAFTIQTYDVTLTMDPVDADNIKGSLMGMFDATGMRVKENK